MTRLREVGSRERDLRIARDFREGGARHRWFSDWRAGAARISKTVLISRRIAVDFRQSADAVITRLFAERLCLSISHGVHGCIRVMRMHADKKSANGPIALISPIIDRGTDCHSWFCRRITIRKVSSIVYYLLFCRKREREREIIVYYKYIVYNGFII